MSRLGRVSSQNLGVDQKKWQGSTFWCGWNRLFYELLLIPWSFTCNSSLFTVVSSYNDRTFHSIYYSIISMRIYAIDAIYIKNLYIKKKKKRCNIWTSRKQKHQNYFFPFKSGYGLIAWIVFLWTLIQTVVQNIRMNRSNTATFRENCGYL